MRAAGTARPQANVDLSDADLVRRALARDGSAFRTIMTTYNQRLYRIARSIVRDDREAEDAVQEGYMLAFTHLESFRGNSSLSTWLTRIVSNAALGAVSFPTARRDLSSGSEQYSLGATAGWSLSDAQAVAVYANVDVLHGDTTWTLSPNFSFALSETVGGYLEAGYQASSARDQPDNAVAGGGLTWLVRPNVQLDAYGLGGLTRDSTDLAAGCGVSVYFR